MAIGWGATDGSFDTIKAVVDDAIEWARLELEIASKRESNDECEDCGNKIPIERIKAVSGVLCCVKCQSDKDTTIKSYYNRRGSKDSQLR